MIQSKLSKLMPVELVRGNFSEKDVFFILNPARPKGQGSLTSKHLIPI